MRILNLCDDVGAAVDAHFHGMGQVGKSPGVVPVVGKTIVLTDCYWKDHARHNYLLRIQYLGRCLVPADRATHVDERGSVACSEPRLVADC